MDWTQEGLRLADVIVASVFKFWLLLAVPMEKLIEQPGLAELALDHPLKLYRVLTVMVTGWLNQAWYAEAPAVYATEPALTPP